MAGMESLNVCHLATGEEMSWDTCLMGLGLTD